MRAGAPGRDRRAAAAIRRGTPGVAPRVHGVLRHLPNALTALRLGLAPVFPASPEGLRPALLVVALLTEAADGFVSRQLRAESALGRLLDPVADKAFFAAVAFTLLAEERLALAELLALAVRDVGVLLALGWMFARRQWARVAGLRPGIAGKTTTVLQYATIGLAVFGVDPPWLLVGSTAAAGALAVAQYGVRLRCERAAPHEPAR